MDKSQEEKITSPKEMLNKVELITSNAREMIEKEVNLKKPVNIQMMMNQAEFVIKSQKL